MKNDYLQYRGKCQEIASAMARNDPSLTLVRGWYYCPIWNCEEEHWWLTDASGGIVDPTKNQFPSKGLGTYRPFSGFVECAECGKEVPENEARGEGRYAFCSYKCHGKFVGVF
jgi:hypothetical protein